MKISTKKLVSLAILFALMSSLSFNVSAASYPAPKYKYDIYDLVRDASKSSGCSKMVPQGITFAGSYLLISACCEEKNSAGTILHKSVVYVFNESNKSYYGTIILPNKSHVGGIAYDCKRTGNIWVSNGKGVACFKYSELSNCKGKVYTLKSFLRKVSLSYQASTMCYDPINNHLWVAQFITNKSDESMSFARCYDVENKTSTDPKNPPKLPFKFQIKVPLKTQGISVRGDKMIISTSYGRTNDSTIYSYDWNQSKKKASNVTITKLPPLSESIVLDSIYLYVLYESVSAEYYNKPDANGKKCTYPVRYFAAYKLSKFGK